MNKQAEPNGNSITHLPIPFGDINNRRFVTAVLAGVLGGAGVSAGANLLRQFRELRQKRKEETDQDTIVLTLPKAAEDGYESMRSAKPGESHPTAGGGTQLREHGQFGKKIQKDVSDVGATTAEKTAEGNPGPNTVGTIVANTLGLTAGGLLSYEVVSRLFDKMNERRLKKKLEAAQQAYVSALNGASKRAEGINAILKPVEGVFSKKAEVKEADVMDVLRYPTAFYLLSLLAGTGATAYVTKKVMDREFPEEKLKTDINKPTRIVFRTEGTPSLVEGAQGEEKAASAETCAALTAMLPIYMDVVEGQPSRTLAEPYQKIAEAAGTDAAGLMKMAATDFSAVFRTVLQDPKALWRILVGTNFGLNFNKLRAAQLLKETSPDTYRRAVDAAIDARWAGGPNDGFLRKAYNTIGRKMTHLYADNGGRDSLVETALAPKAAETKEAGLSPTAVQILRSGFTRGSGLLKAIRALKNGSGTGDIWRNRLQGLQADALRSALSNRASGLSAAQTLQAGSRYPGSVGLLPGEASALSEHNMRLEELLRRVAAKVNPGVLNRAPATDDMLVRALARIKSGIRTKTAAADDLLRASYIGSSVFKGTEPEEPKPEEPEPAKSVIAKAKKGLKDKRKVTVQAADPAAAAFVERRKAVIQKLLARLNAQGAI